MTEISVVLSNIIDDAELTGRGERGNPQHLIELVEAIRPGQLFISKRREVATKRLKALIKLLRENDSFRTSLRSYILDLLNAADHIPLYTESGLQSQSGFFSEAFQKATHLILPPVYNPKSLRDLIHLVFHENDDHLWLMSLSDDLLVELLDVLGLGSAIIVNDVVDVQQGTYHQLLNATLILSHKLAAMGLEADILTRLPEFEELNSPFMTQNRELVRYVEFIRKQNIHPEDKDSNADDHALVMLRQCADCVEYLRKYRGHFGASLDLTYQMQRISQHINRLRTLVKLTLKPDEINPQALSLTIVEFLKEVVREENQKHSLSKHINDNTGMLAFQVAENAAKTGEHYITSSRLEFKLFLFASMGGGLIVVFLAAIKLFFYYLHLPPFGEALSYGLTYGTGFIVIHILGFALATKQPAMTASTIAESLDTKKKDGGKEGSKQALSLPDLVVMISKISRSQLISFVGNLIIAFPLGYVLGWIFYIIGVPLADEHKAHKMIAELHPFLSGSLFYAAIAGTMLFSAGLMSGYFDNRVVFSNIPERLRQHPLLKRFLPKDVLESFAAYIETNLGAMAGNFFLGLLLGSAATVGFIFGLPIDIRHITFSSASFGIAIASVGNDVTRSQIVWTSLGIFGIGFMNFIVSFSLALFVAMRSRKVTFKQSAKLVELVGKYFLKHPSEFFFPPKNAIGSSSQH